MWLDEDQDADLAYLEWLADDEQRRCPRCHTRPDEWFDDQGREYRDAPWEAQTVECLTCGMVADANHDLGEHDASRSVVLVRPDPDRVHPADTDD